MQHLNPAILYNYLVINCVFVAQENAEGVKIEEELVQPESEEDDDDDVLTIVDESLSTSTMARNASASVGVSRAVASATPTPVTSTKGGKGKRRAETTVTQTNKRIATSKFRADICIHLKCYEWKKFERNRKHFN